MLSVLETKSLANIHCPMDRTDQIDQLQKNFHRRPSCFDNSGKRNQSPDLVRLQWPVSTLWSLAAVYSRLSHHQATLLCLTFFKFNSDING